MIKPCVKCGSTDRYKNGACKPCAKAGIAAYYQANKESIKTRHTAYRKANPEKHNARNAVWAKANPEKVKAKNAVIYQENKENIKTRHAAYRKVNIHKYNALSAKRRSAKLNAIPAWANNWLEKLKIQELFLIAKVKSKVEGIPYHVDHIAPLQSDLVCGLHCFNNLRVIPASENISKGNRTWPDMP